MEILPQIGILDHLASGEASFGPRLCRKIEGNACKYMHTCVEACVYTLMPLPPTSGQEALVVACWLVVAGWLCAAQVAAGRLAIGLLLAASWLAGTALGIATARRGAD